MASAREAITGKTLAGFAVLVVVLGLFAAPIEFWVGPAWRPTVVRITAAFFCAVFAYRIVIVIKAAALVGLETPADVALRPHIELVQVDPLLVQLAKEARPGIGLRFMTPALWNRVHKLCLRRGLCTADQPTNRRTLQDVERIIQHLEDAT
jgi:hypothetical protein